MISPRRTRLVRAPSLRAATRAIIDTALADGPLAARATAVLVPTRAAGAALARAIASRALDAHRAVILPDLLTRSDWYDRLHAGLPDPPRLVSVFEREVLLQASAHEAITEGIPPPFRTRPALIVDMLALYDDLRRSRTGVEDFARRLLAEFGSDADTDRGIARMRLQTAFLEAAWLAYERRLEGIGAVDEHGLRGLAANAPAPGPYARVVVTVGDRAADLHGLWSADFDLLTRMPGVRAIDVIATERHLSTGLEDRLRALLPGIKDEVVADASDPPGLPLLEVPAEGDAPYFVSRDREEELVDLARRVKGLCRSDAIRLDRVAVVFTRPLPYIYLARAVFDQAGLPFQALDALPLGAEPFAAALDLVLEAAHSALARRPLIELLRSPHFRFEVEGGVAGPREIRTLDRALAESGYLGGGGRLSALAASWRDEPDRARAAAAAALVAQELAPLAERAPASRHLDTLRTFIATHARLPAADDPLAERLLRARGAIVAILDGLAEAHRRHGDLAWDLTDLTQSIRRFVEAETFAPRAGSAGVHLVDAASARYGDYDRVFLVGLVEGEWPDRARRNIFFPQGLLQKLDRPGETTRRLAERAAFLDLVGLARSVASVSTFLLEDDAPVEPSVFLEELPKTELARSPVSVPATPILRVEALLARPVAVEALSPGERQWAELRRGRTHQADARYHGFVGPVALPSIRVSALERYLRCPFQYFADHVLGLDEEPADAEEGLDPRSRGTLLHRVFEAFFREWQARGHGRITPALLPEALALVEDVSAPLLAALSAADAQFERTRLLGSAVAMGVAEHVFRHEAASEGDVVERRLEYGLSGAYELAGPLGPRTVTLRGKADRVDLMGDGTFRVVDYKSSAPKDPKLQLAIYALCARQLLQGYNGRSWGLGDALYLVLRDGSPVVPLARQVKDTERVLLQAQSDAVQAVSRIERGAFPPQPHKTAFCISCPWTAVCRKDYWDDEDATPAV